ncbi:MAG: group II intron reverse transcriptase/maturase [Euryarchaeota archaeon]|nr:group II intron reverse transcriptase/maturase [Euryarchaeota archaeon]MDE1837427.1 group II intron reverse transcriptase/maturase [Euryarchaeota archaeon]MDE1881952.1 group II intron reverse transcriptase/maturase [Euryarchaeota archaeon]MDE2045607.1 group II intron reverse transcriptase/maturase [Thermoplasmata archaeon]
MRRPGADRPVVVSKAGNPAGAKGASCPGSPGGQPSFGREELKGEPRPKGKPFDISQKVVREAYEKVKANRGAAGVDEESIEQFERDLDGNLYKLWNRMSSGTYFPPPVRAVEIPKKSGGVRVLGVPTVADRIAQTVARMYLEPRVEPLFHADSYGYRPGRSALDAVATCRQRCWRYDWVIDLDIRSFFDSVRHDLLLEWVSKHTDLRWVLLYVERWLKAPLQQEDGTLVPRDRGTPQGSAISPLLANLYLHYALDQWMAQEYPHIPFERYADDCVAHCKSEKQAWYVLEAVSRRMARTGLELNREKTRIVYCKDVDRGGSYENQQFDFLGYTYRPRLAKDRQGRYFVSFLPAVSNAARQAIGSEIRSWHLVRRSDKDLSGLARLVNPVVQGWVNYYGRFYPSWLVLILRQLNDTLVRWATRKYKRLRRHYRRAARWLVGVYRRQPDLFAHWKAGARPDGRTVGAG